MHFIENPTKLMKACQQHNDIYFYVGIFFKINYAVRIKMANMQINKTSN